MDVAPAYGRRYRSLEKTKADWDANLDFVLLDPSSRWNGKAVNKEQVPADEPVYSRYGTYLEKKGRVQ